MIRLASRTMLGAALSLALAAPAPAQADACRVPAKAAAAKARDSGCKPQEKIVPYEPDQARARPGVFQFGNGTEVRVGGRVQMDYDSRR